MRKEKFSYKLLHEKKVFVLFGQSVVQKEKFSDEVMCEKKSFRVK